MTQYHFSFFESYYLSSFVWEKIFYFHLKNFFHNLTLHFILKNNFSNRILFLLKIMLLKKITNNKISFVYNKFLLKNKNLKIGGWVQLGNQKLYNFFLILFFYSLPKFVFHSSTFFYLYDSKYDCYVDLFFWINKFLFLNYFTLSMDYYNYYEFFENVIFQLKIRVSTCFKYYLINRDLFRLVGLNIL
jgi:hypothetical protein